jgi:short-subunit dehydrogenase
LVKIKYTHPADERSEAMNDRTFQENVVILTGASSGIGREMAYQLARQGAWLSLAARDAMRLEQVAHTCREAGARALVVETDVVEQSQCQRLMARTVETYGRIDTLINNAGLTMWALFEEMQTLTPFEQVMQVNYFGSLYCTYYALPYLKQVQGRLSAIASPAGKTGVPIRSGYAASKHALVGLFDSLRIELASSGVSVTLVFPDFVATETRQRAFGADGKPLGVSPVQETRVMSAETCARQALQAIARRQRQVMLGRGRFLQYALPFVPGLIDRLAAKAIQQGR